MEQQLALSKEEFVEVLTLRREVDDYGTVCWFNADGVRHRVDGPAIERADGTKHWWLNGKRHREDGPAVIGATGTKIWFLNGKEVEPF